MRSLTHLIAILPFALVVGAGCSGSDEVPADPGDGATDSSASDETRSDSAIGTDTGTTSDDTASPGDVDPSDTKAGDSGSGDATVGDTKVGDSGSDTTSSDTTSSDTKLGDTGLGDTGLGDTSVFDTPPADVGPRKGPAPVSLGLAGNYVILAQSKVSTVPDSVVTGDIGISPSAATFLTGFSMTKVGTYWTSTQVIGKLFAADNDEPTPTLLTTAITNMTTAYTDAATRPTPDSLNLGTGAIGGLTLTPGLYRWTSSVGIASDVTVSGNAEDTWIFQITGDLTAASFKSVKLLGAAKAKNIVWQVAGLVDLGTDSHFEGVILCKTGITLQTGASINGRLLSQTAVAIAKSKVSTP